MDFNDFMEIIHFDFLLESLGFLFGFHLLYQLFFQKGLYTFISLFITTIC